MHPPITPRPQPLDGAVVPIVCSATRAPARPSESRSLSSLVSRALDARRNRRLQVDGSMAEMGRTSPERSQRESGRCGTAFARSAGLRYENDHMAVWKFLPTLADAIGREWVVWLHGDLLRRPVKKHECTMPSSTGHSLPSVCVASLMMPKRLSMTAISEGV